MTRHRFHRLLPLLLGGLIAFALAAPASAETRTVELNTGAKLFVETAGAGRPLLVIHGGLGLDHTYFQPWLDPLQKSFQLIYPDLRGNGRSAGVADADFTIDKMVDDLEALRNALGIKQWAVLGHSYGGYVAQAYALKYPAAVSYLMLIDTSPSTRLIPKQEAAQLLARKMTPEITTELGNLGKVVTKAAPEGGNEEWARIWHTILPIYFNDFPAQVLIPGDRTVYNEHALVLGGTLMATFDTRPALAKLTMPTLVAVGRWDAILPMSHSEILYKSIPGAQLVVFRRSGHFPFIEEQGRFLEVVRTFLGE
jgi:proline iminopeptidase